MIKNFLNVGLGLLLSEGVVISREPYVPKVKRDEAVPIHTTVVDFAFQVVPLLYPVVLIKLSRYCDPLISTLCLNGFPENGGMVALKEDMVSV